jgi:hypothetical protein
LSMMVPVPVFLTYKVCVATPPAAIDPQLMDVTTFVQLASENTPMFGDVVIVPEEAISWRTTTAANPDAHDAITLKTKGTKSRLTLFDNANYGFSSN